MLLLCKHVHIVTLKISIVSLEHYRTFKLAQNYFELHSLFALSNIDESC